MTTFAVSKNCKGDESAAHIFYYYPPLGNWQNVWPDSHIHW